LKIQKSIKSAGGPEESRLGKGAEDRMFRVVYPKMFEGSKYAERLPIGKDDILKNFKYDAIKRFYRDWYRPDLMAVLVVVHRNRLKPRHRLKTL
jgi:predicted Zn-dependent peptidase